MYFSLWKRLYFLVGGHLREYLCTVLIRVIIANKIIEYEKISIIYIYKQKILILYEEHKLNMS